MRRFVAGLRKHRNAWLVPMLVVVFVGSWVFAGGLWPFTLGLLLVVWGVRVRGLSDEDVLFERLERDFGRAG